MDKSFWATRSGRWRIKLAGHTDEYIAKNLADVIADEIEDRQLPIGALLPTAEHVGRELNVDPEIISEAYSQLLTLSLLSQDDTGTLSISTSAGVDKDFGAVTQVALEKQLIEAAKSANNLGKTTLEATGLFKQLLEESDPKDE